MRRVVITVVERTPRDKAGRCSMDVTHTTHDGETKFTCYRANPEEVVKRLRHNIAAQFWFDRYRIRLAREAQEGQ